MFDLNEFQTTPEEDRSGKTLQESDGALIANLVSTITHDLKNYIAAIRIRGDILQINPDRFKALELWTEIKPSLIQLDESLMAAREVVRWMRTPVNELCRNIELNNLLTQCLSAYQKKIGEKNLSLQVKTPEKSLAISAVESAIKQTILMPLIDNLVKFAFPDTRIVIQMDSVDNNMRLRLAGSGYEVPEDTREAVFNSIEREKIRKRGTNNESGLGFSLYLTNYIVNQYNGSICFDSIVNPDIKIPASDSDIESRKGAINIVTLKLPLA